MRVSASKVNPILKKQIEETFIQTLSDLKDTKELKVFLGDFFNQTEMETFVKRLAVAYWLKKKRSYTNIKDNLKVSSATIATIQDLIKSPGFKLALTKMEAEEWANQWVEKISKVWPKIK